MLKPILYILITSVTLLSAQEIKVNKGDLESGISAVLSRGELGLDFNAGAFIADYTQVGIEVGYEDTDFLTQYNLGAYVKWFIETNTYALPYFGLGMGFNSLEGGDTETNSGLDMSMVLGLRYYLAENVALDTEFRSAWSSDKTYIDNDKAVDSDFRLTFGLSYLW